MGNEKWTNVNLLKSLVEEIDTLVENNKYSSRAGFVEIAVREKLAKETITKASSEEAA